MLPAPAGPVELLETLCPEWKKDPDTLAARNDSSFSFPCHSVTLSAKCQMASFSRDVPTSRATQLLGMHLTAVSVQHY